MYETKSIIDNLTERELSKKWKIFLVIVTWFINSGNARMVIVTSLDNITLCGIQKLDKVPDGIYSWS